MSKRFAVIAFAFVLGFLNFGAIEAKSKKHKKLGFELEDCTRVDGDPDIYICLKGEAGDGFVTEARLDSISGKTIDLVRRYRARSMRNKASNRRFLQGSDPCNTASINYDPVVCASYYEEAMTSAGSMDDGSIDYDPATDPAYEEAMTSVGSIDDGSTDYDPATDPAYEATMTSVDSMDDGSTDYDPASSSGTYPGSYDPSLNY
jgi:hypothetical protein